MQEDGTAPRVYDSRAFYEPFGGYRLEPTGDYTDRGYTGHPSTLLRTGLGNNSGSNDIGLIYMNARFYVPGVARFASADTIVPDPANPQSFNRFSYVQNNPLNLIDPTGHCGADLNDDGSVNQDLFDQCIVIRDELESIYEIFIKGDWRLEEISLLQNAIVAIVDFFESEGISDGGAAFRDRWSGTIIKRVEVTCGYGCAFGRNKIEIGDVAFGREEAKMIETFVHEFAHIWDHREWSAPARGLRAEVGGRNECVFLFFGCRYKVDEPSPAPSAVQEHASRRGWN